MKKILAILLILFTFEVWAKAQESISDSLINRNETLEYRIAVISSNNKNQQKLISDLKKEITKRHWAISLTDNAKDYPDVIFTTIGPEFMTKFPKQTACRRIIPIKNRKNPVKQIVRYIEKEYYSGEQPIYSTVFSAKQDGYELYRIPSVLTLSNGRILAIAEARGIAKTDCAENDIVLKYSDDEGRSWSPLILMAESGKASLNNPTSVYIAELGRVLVLFQEYPPTTNEYLTQSGLEGDNITRTYIIYSDDNGITWSKKRDITRQIKLPEATGYASGPGAGLRVTSGPDKGRIIIPLNVTGYGTDWFNYLAASDDLGENWFILPGKSMYGTNESQIVQISDTTFLIDARSHRFYGDCDEAPEGWNPWQSDKIARYRAMIPVSICGDRTHWDRVTIRRDMPDPVCQGAIIRYSGLDGEGKSRILSVNAASGIGIPPARINGTVRISYNEGTSWKYSKRIYGNRFTEFQYSVLTSLQSGKIGCLFETGNQIRFATFDLEWLTAGEDK